VRSLTRPSLLFGAQIPDSTRKDSLPAGWRDYVVVQRGPRTDTLDFHPTGPLNEFSLADTSLQQVKVSFHIRPGIPVYGANFEGGSGIYLDNFASRGNTGIPLASLRPSLLQATQARFSYDLIVLQFGLNMIDSTRTNYQQYQRDLVKVINHLKICMPGAAILLVSIGDKATRIDGRLHTDPCVPYILAAQRNAAIETGSAFLNLYEAMGGYNSIVRWADQKPILANKDYTHPNHAGAQKLADIILAYLMDGYTE
jgi:lysophospholipase L1-like esterase